MNVTDIIDRVTRAFGDESAVQLTNDDIFRYINDAQRDIVIHNDSLLETVITKDLIQGQKEYDFPSDLLLLRTIRIKEDGMESYRHIKYRSLFNFDTFVDGWDGTFHGEGIPCTYTSYGRKIFLFPPPQKNSPEGLKILFSKKPVDITGEEDLLSLPDMYHTAIVDYCLRQASIMDEDYDASQVHQVQFTDKVRSLSYQDKYGADETYPVITPRPEDAW